MGLTLGNFGYTRDGLICIQQLTICDATSKSFDIKKDSRFTTDFGCSFDAFLSLFVQRYTVFVSTVYVSIYSKCIYSICIYSMYIYII